MSAVSKSTLDNIRHSDMATTQPNDRFCRLKDIMEMLNVSKTSIYDRMNPRSPRYDSEFPRRVKVGHGTVAWRESEIQQWMKTRQTI